MAEKICGNVRLVGGSELTDPGDCMVYLVNLGSQAVLIDAGTGRATDRLLQGVHDAGVDPSAISAIVLTHCHVDHIGGANEIRERTGAKVYAHEEDASAIEEAIPSFTVEHYYGMRLEPIPVDVQLSGAGGDFDFAPGRLRWIHTPGHTPGSIALVFASPAGETVLFGQDIHGPFEPGFGSDMAAWRKSMERLLALEPDILCEGHFGVHQPGENARRFIERYLEHYT